MFNREELAQYLRGEALRVMYELPEVENMDTFDWWAKVVEIYLKEKGIL